MNNYDNLKPGLYLQVGQKVTAVKNASFLEALMRGHSQHDLTLESLAEKVGWVFIALQQRRTQLIEIPLQWRLNDDDIDDPPYTMNEMDLICRLDMALQIYGYGYWYKERTRGGGITIKWLDPTSVEPDLVRLDRDGRIARFWRTTREGLRKTLLAEDVIYFQAPGLREIEPGTSAMYATKIAGDLLYGSDLALSSLYGNNALPIHLISVPMATSREDKQELESRWRRFLNPKRRGSVENRVVAVNADANGSGVTVTQLSFSPDQLGTETIETSNRLEVLAAHDVPEALIVGDAANMATAEYYDVRFINSMAARIKQIANVLDHDADFGGQGYELVPAHQRLPTMQKWYITMAASALPLVQSGIMSVDEIREWMNLDPAVNITEPQPEPETAVTEPDETAKSFVWDDEAKQFRRWYKKRPGADVGEFNANHLTHADKVIIADELLRESIESYP